MEIKIKVHSFIDVITNSSTEIYVSADQGTIKAIKALIDNILKLGNSTLKADDLFTFEIYCEREREYYIGLLADNYMSDEQYQEYKQIGYSVVENLVKEIEALDKKPEWWKSFEDKYDYDDFYDSEMIVKAKDDNPDAEAAAKVLSSLTSLFDIEADYNG